MAEAYVGEIRMFSGQYAPVGWEFCNGQLLSITEHEALYVLLGTTYGGDGQTNFALPDLRGRLPLHISSNYPLGSMGGTESITLIQNQLPSHTHSVIANNTLTAATESSPANNVWGVSSVTNYQANATSNLVAMNTSVIAPVGGNQAHNNIMPSLAVNFIIAKWGIFPTEN
ncbi:tail fiber protein [Metasolibacillus meyeri]|uniref:Tail fiber protein n=1 Tax=Metasolibacillus meyeri TaxID=1071052 RepID=A0AAW9NW79_9BACL|nr:tail fiber protein [Metasolibacillus meyeri]MEC1179521.1 tail fiber protein [Metasolibacillus meyeri]